MLLDESLVDECETSGAGIAECLFSDGSGCLSNRTLDDNVILVQLGLLSGR